MTPVFVINLARDTERRDLMAAELAQIGLSAQFVPAVDGRALDPAERAEYDRRRCLRYYGVEMLPSEIGCYLSHRQLYARICRDGIDAALILEDDMRLDPALPAVVEGLRTCPVQDWSVVRLNTLRRHVEFPTSASCAGQRLCALSGEYGLYRLGTHVLGAGAYLIKHDGAARMLEYGRRIFMPIDHTMDRYWDNGILPHVVRPFPAHHRTDMASRIGARPAERRRDLPLSAQVGRRWQRLQDSVRKRIFALRGGFGTRDGAG